MTGCWSFPATSSSFPSFSLIEHALSQAENGIQKMNDEIHNSSIIDNLLDKWRRRKWLFIILFVAIFGVIASYVLPLPSLYRSSTTILFGQGSISESLVRAAQPNELELRLDAVRQAVMSRTQLQELIDEFDLYPKLRATVPAEAVINRLRKDISIDQRASTQPQWGQNSTYTITISYQTWDADLAARIANSIAARFQTENERIRTGQAERTTEFLRAELEQARLKFVAEEEKVSQFKSRHMGELPEQQAINLATLERLNSELRLKGEKQVQLLDRRNALLFGTNTTTATPVIGLTGALRLDRLQNELAEMRQRYTDSYPGVIRLKSDIAALEQELANAPERPRARDSQPTRQNPAEIDQELANLTREEQEIRANITELISRIELTPMIDQQLQRLSYDYNTAREEYFGLQKLYQDARLAESLEIEQNQEFRVIEMAIPPDFPVAPNHQMLLIMAFVIASGVAGGAVLLADLLDNSFHHVSDIRRFTRVPVLASIATIRTSADRWRMNMKYAFVSVLVVASLLLMVNYSYYLGANGEQTVWVLSE